MAAPADLQLSVVVVTPGRFASLRRTVRHLRAQTLRERLELVIVAPSAEALEDRRRGELAGFARVSTVETGPISNLDRAAAPGIRRAAAPVVALLEDHAYPDPGWAEALVSAHRAPWAAVGSAIANANPRTMTSWANLLIAYGRWLEPTLGGETDSLPGHNISYKRAPLLPYGDRLEELLGRGGLLGELRSEGHRLYLEPAARIQHANPSLLSSTAKLRFNVGRLYAATSADARWSVTQRLAYLAAGPLIPFVNFYRLRRRMLGGGQRPALVPSVYPALLFGLIMDGAGQMAGNLLGAGDAAAKLAAFEIDRLRHLELVERRFLEE